MKKTLVLLLALTIILTLSACGDGQVNSVPALAPSGSQESPSDIGSEEASSDISSQEVSSQEASSQESSSQESSSAASSSKPSVPPTSSTVKQDPPVLINGTYTGRAPLEPVEYTVFDTLNTRGLSTVHKGFSFGAAKNGQPHSITVNNQNVFDGYNANSLAWDNKSGEKVLYLTFDCGYPYGDLVPRILDTLSQKQVKAAFFVTMQYLNEAPAMVARMINEGHIVGNHTVNHPVCTKISREKLASELLGVDNRLRTQYGYESKYFRYPTGAYSEDTLDLVKSLGYRSVFWSIAHADWDPLAQPGVEKSFNTVTSRLHSGAVILLHSTSPDNADILARFIDYAVAQGYTFKSLDEYGFWVI